MYCVYGKLAMAIYIYIYIYILDIIYFVIIKIPLELYIKYGFIEGVSVRIMSHSEFRQQMPLSSYKCSRTEGCCGE